MRAPGIAAGCLALVCLVAPAAGQEPPAVQARHALPVGVAASATEAPGGQRLAGPLPGDESPAQGRAMGFTAGGGPVCRETVPGGTLLVVAYAVAVAFMGVYVALLARKSAKLTAALDGLEAAMAQRRREDRAGPPGGGAPGP